MATIFGALGINDSERIFNATAGQRAIYDLIQTELARHNADIAAATAVFVEEQTEEFKRRYKLPGGGRMQRRGHQSPPGAIKASGGWDVAFPLEDFADQIAGNDVDLAYMTAADLDRHIRSIQQRDVNTRRFEILRAILNNTQRSFVDQTGRGTLSIEPLANGDSVVYPPVLGSETEATDNHYLESGYAASAISDSNNPFVTGRDELEEHFGASEGNSNIVAFINNAQRAKTEALTDFDPINDRFTRPGQDTDTLFDLPAVPGRIIGRTDGVWVAEWRWVPANYIVFIHLDAPKPLIERVDPADTGLGRGLQLVARDLDFPFEASFWRDRFGYGCGNRLNGVVIELGTGGSYTIPTGYS